MVPVISWPRKRQGWEIEEKGRDTPLSEGIESTTTIWLKQGHREVAETMAVNIFGTCLEGPVWSTYSPGVTFIQVWTGGCPTWDIISCGSDHKWQTITLTCVSSHKVESPFGQSENFDYNKNARMREPNYVPFPEFLQIRSSGEEIVKTTWAAEWKWNRFEA